MVTQVANFDVAGLADRMCTFAQELQASQSATQAEFNPHDRARSTAYIERLVEFVNLTTSDDNPLDLPKTHPSMYPVHAFIDDQNINSIENAEVRDVVRRFKAGWVEVLNSQSADRASGLQAQDKGRILALLESTLKVVQFGESTPDLPETATNTTTP